MSGAAEGGSGADRDSPRSRSWHRLHHHTAELEIELGADSLAGLFVESAAALVDLLQTEEATGETPAERTLELEARDSEALLVAWLNELIFLAETELWVPVDVEIAEICATTLRARCRGRRLHESPTLVKAATYHGLRIESSDGGLEASVVLDV